MHQFHKALPVWVRAILLAGLVCLVGGAGLIGWRLYARPTTLTVAVGSFDGEARQAASLIAGHLATSNAPIRLKVENAGNVLDAAKAFASGKADLAVVRADVGDLSQARAVAVMAEGVVMIVAPPGSNITSIAKLRDHTVGVIGGEINHGVVEALKKEYDLAQAHVTFKDITPLDARRAVQAKEVAVVIAVVPLTDRYLSLIKGLFREGANASPVLILLDANRHLNQEVVGELAKRVMSTRRDLAAEQPLIAGIATPTLDAEAYIAVHPGAAAFYNGTQESFMDRWGNAIYLTPMALGALASVFAAAWRFLGIRGNSGGAPGALDHLHALRERIRSAEDEAGLRKIEDEIDAALRAHFALSADDDENGSERLAAIGLAQRLENLIHHRRLELMAAVSAPNVVGSQVVKT